jgi:hypothetical protein
MVEAFEIYLSDLDPPAIHPDYASQWGAEAIAALGSRVAPL